MSVMNYLQGGTYMLKQDKNRNSYLFKVRDIWFLPPNPQNAEALISIYIFSRQKEEFKLIPIDLYLLLPLISIPLLCSYIKNVKNVCFRENILLTVGFAKLLMAQKLAQFRGLCDKNNVSYINIVMINNTPRA